MAKATGARSELTYIAESAYGATPGTPAMVIIPRTAGVPVMQKETFESADISADRHVVNQCKAKHKLGFASLAQDLALQIAPADVG